MLSYIVYSEFLEGVFMLYSFDVFDTLLTRKTATPDGIFAIMQHELQVNSQWAWLPLHVRNNFYHLRISAEKEARKSYRYFSSSDEVSLPQIYSFLPLNDDALSKTELLMDLEIETESKNSIGIRDNINRVLSLLSEGNKVILISDMYLPEKIIRNLLCQQDPVFSCIPIYVSSDIGVTKASGKLFNYVADNENVCFSNWTHVGDNVKSDFRIPKKLGIKSELYQYVDLNNLEKKALVQYSDNPHVQLSIGVSKNIRLQHPESPKQYKFGASLGGPLLVPYVYWILNDAKERGVNRLYFIARDGYVLKKIADEIIKQHNIEISTNYIYGSRLAWRLFDLNQNYVANVSKLSKINSVYDLVTLLLDGIGGENTDCCISKSRILGLFPKEYRSETKSLTKKETELLVNCLIDDSSFMECYNLCISFKRDLIKQYIIQEIDVSDSNFAFVDLNGSGVTMECLAELMRDFYPSNLNIYYMFNCYSTYPLSYITKRIYSVNTPNYFEIELLCRALHGQTIGYNEEGGIVLPIIEAEEELELREWGYEYYISGVIDFVKTVLSYSAYGYGHGFTLHSYYLTAYYKDYDCEILDLLATIPFSKTTKSGTCRGYAPRVSLIQLSTDFIRYGGKHCLCTNNVKLSMKRSSPLLRFMLKYVFDGDGILYNIASWGYRVLKNIMGLFNLPLGRGSK